MRNAVLIVTGAGDAHAAAVARELAIRGAASWTWNVDRFPEETPFSALFDPDGPQPVRGVLRTEDGDLPLENVKSVWLRRNLLGLFAPRSRPDDLGVFLGFEFESAFRGLADCLRDARWVNPPEALYAMESEIAQLDAAAAAGLPAARTRITNGVNVDQEDLDVEADVSFLIAGDAGFAFEHGRDAAPDDFTSGRLPQHIESGCFRLMRNLGLALGCIRLVRTADGEHLFLGCDAVPDWLPMEYATSQPVTARVADLLARERE